jgi:O-antigen/teichoic acid export membrane protein
MEMARLGWPLFLATTLGIVYFKIDIAMLTEMVGEAATGIYFLGHRPLDYMLFLPNIFATAFFPAMARYGSASEDVSRLGERALRYLLSAMLPLTLLIIFVAEPIIHWFEGRSGGDTDFADSIVVLRIVMLGVAFQSANYVFNRLLIAAGRERVFVAIATVPLLANVSLNLLLIPRWTYYGAALTSVVSLVLSCVMHLVFLRNTDLRVPLTRAVAGPTVALAAGWLVTSFLAQTLFPAWGTGWFNLPLQVGWGPFLLVAGTTLVLYGLALVIGRVIRQDDLRLLRQLGKAD